MQLSVHVFELIVKNIELHKKPTVFIIKSFDDFSDRRFGYVGSRRSLAICRLGVHDRVKKPLNTDGSAAFGTAE